MMNKLKRGWKFWKTYNWKRLWHTIEADEYDFWVLLGTDVKEQVGV